MSCGIIKFTHYQSQHRGGKLTFFRCKVTLLIEYKQPNTFSTSCIRSCNLRFRIPNTISTKLASIAADNQTPFTKQGHQFLFFIHPPGQYKTEHSKSNVLMTYFNTTKYMIPNPTTRTQQRKNMFNFRCRFCMLSSNAFLSPLPFEWPLLPSSSSSSESISLTWIVPDFFKSSRYCRCHTQ